MDDDKVKTISSIVDKIVADPATPQSVKDAVTKARDNGRFEEILTRVMGDDSSEKLSETFLTLLASFPVPTGGSALSQTCALFLAKIEQDTGRGDSAKELLISSINRMYPLLVASNKANH